MKLKVTQKDWFYIPLLFSFFMMSSCAILSPRSISDVPTINVAKIKSPPLKNIPKKILSLKVLDNRDPQFKKNSEELQKELQNVVTQVLKSQGILVSSTATTSLLISAQDQGIGKYKDGCVKINAMLSIPQTANIFSDATSCFEVKSPVSSISMGSDISESYEMALTEVFQHLGNNLQKLETLKK